MLNLYKIKRGEGNRSTQSMQRKMVHQALIQRFEMASGLVSGRLLGWLWSCSEQVLHKGSAQSCRCASQSGTSRPYSWRYLGTAPLVSIQSCENTGDGFILGEMRGQTVSFDGWSHPQVLDCLAKVLDICVGVRHISEAHKCFCSLGRKLY